MALPQEASGVDGLVSLTIPFNVPPADERAGQQEKGLMNVPAAFVADSQSAKSAKPPECSFDDPTQAAKPFRVTRPRISRCVRQYLAGAARHGALVFQS
jgi:hypothetical protein